MDEYIKFCYICEKELDLKEAYVERFVYGTFYYCAECYEERT